MSGVVASIAVTLCVVLAAAGVVAVVAAARAARWDDGLDETDTLPRMRDALDPR